MSPMGLPASFDWKSEMSGKCEKSVRTDEGIDEASTLEKMEP